MFRFENKTIFVFAFLFPVLFAFSFSVYSQNKFEGYNIILNAPKDHTSAVCALRYSPPATNITISDLNPSTPMNVKPCSGSGTNLTMSGNTANMRANSSDYKWCFTGEDKRYRISYDGDRYSGKQIYDWIPTPDEKTLGFYNIKDWGAIGDGRADDTIAIQSALAFIGSRGGGVLTFPEGDYSVGNSSDYKGLVIPSGTTIQGVSGLHSGAAVNNVNQKSATRITLNGSNRPLFLIGECIEKVVMKDIELYANSNDNTSGIEAVGAYNSSQDFYFERVTFSRFNRGINAYGLMITQRQWQFDYIKINHCRFVFNRDAGIYADLPNSDWKIEGSLFINPKHEAGQNADSMNLARVTAATIQDTYGGGFHGAYGGTFIKTIDGGNLTVIGSETEQMTNSFVFNEEKNPQAGNYSYPITFINCFFGHPIIFNGRRTFVSIGNAYNPKTFKADEQLRVYSTGDRWCYDGYILGCNAGGEERFASQNLFDRATVVMMTGQPSEGKTPGFPTIFGTDVQFNTPVQMPSLQLNQLPGEKPNGSMVYCANCRRNTTPCQAGGSGAPAMMVGNQWSCL
ncbi:MAG: glycosyl hydrolase family 28-related protein [Pyrinomonadaceae bacterium]